MYIPRYAHVQGVVFGEVHVHLIYMYYTSTHAVCTRNACLSCDAMCVTRVLGVLCDIRDMRICGIWGTCGIPWYRGIFTLWPYVIVTYLYLCVQPWIHSVSDHPDSGVVRYDTLVRWWYLGWYVTSGIVHYHSVRVISHYRYVTYASVICAYLVYLGYTGTPQIPIFGPLF